MKNKLFTLILVLQILNIFTFAYSDNITQDKNISLKAYFSYTVDSMRNVIFVDESTGDINRYLWNFGDSTYIEEKNPKYQYKKNGSYLVTLTVTNKNNFQDTYSKLISIDGFNTVSGMVFAGPNRLEKGHIFLVETNESNFKVFDSKIINYGNFVFEAVPNGSYTFCVIPDFDFNFHYFPKYIATYYERSFMWNKSDFIVIEENKIDQNIHLISYNEIFYGEASIKGNFKFETNLNVEDRTPINIILLNENKEPMDFRPINTENNSYTFDELPYGKYYIHPEISGLISYDFEVILTPDNYIQTDINFNIDERNNIIFNIPKPPETEPKDIDIIFNLNKGNIDIRTDNKIKESVICKLFDMSGKIVLDRYETPPNIIIDASHINTGLYILDIKTFGNKKICTKKIIVNN